MLSSLDIVGSALTAQRKRTEIISQNISNVYTTVTESGDPYRRKQVVFQERPLSFDETLAKATGGVEIAAVIDSDRDFKQVYDPTHPEADENGIVLYPNVDVTEETFDLMAASNAYEANLAVLTVMKAMITKTMDMSQ